MIRLIRKILGISDKARKTRAPKPPIAKSQSKIKVRRNYVAEAVAEISKTERAERASAKQIYKNLDAKLLDRIVNEAIENARHEAQSKARHAATIAQKQGMGRISIIRAANESAIQTYRTAISHALQPQVERAKQAQVEKQRRGRRPAPTARHAPRKANRVTKKTHKLSTRHQKSRSKEVKQIRAELDSLRGKHSQLTERMRDVTFRGGKKSKNADYHDTKERLIALEDRIRFYETALAHAIIARTNESNGIAKIGSTVVIRFEESNENEAYRIVSTPLGKGTERTISAESPTGMAVLGKRAGNSVTVHTPDGATMIRIVDVR